MRRSPVRWRDGAYAALDFETTGLDPRSDAVISFGVVPVDLGRVRLDRSVYRVADPGVALTADTVRVHGIRPVDLADAPPIDLVSRELAAVLEDRLVVAWTAWVEVAFLARTLGGSVRSWRSRTIDVRNLAAHVDRRRGVRPSPAKSESLGECARRFDVPLEGSHHALSDALVTAQLFIVTAGMLDAEASLDVRYLVRLGYRPPED